MRCRDGKLVRISGIQNCATLQQLGLKFSSLHVCRYCSFKLRYVWKQTQEHMDKKVVAMTCLCDTASEAMTKLNQMDIKARLFEID